MKFVDEASISVFSGKGGAGCISFRREAGVPKGGPDGGDAGCGGSVYLEVSAHNHSLHDFHRKRKYRAQDGQPGGSRLKKGADGEDLVLKVPPGTSVFNEDTGELMWDLVEGKVLLLEGGKGGKGNAFFKNSVIQAPRKAQPGLPGQGLNLRLELKLLADVGLVGFPNSGKSTLISALSKARPKVANYPFTTLQPVLGVVSASLEKSFVMADMPGLIEGAHKGQGLGLVFLKHVERVKILACVCDISDMCDIEPIKAFDKIMLELRQYKLQDLEGIPLDQRLSLVILNKVDAVVDRKPLLEYEAYFRERQIPCFVISAATRENVKALMFHLEEQVFKGEGREVRKSGEEGEDGEGKGKGKGKGKGVL